MNVEKIILYVMQILILAAAFGYLWAVTFIQMPESGTDHSKTIVGFLLGTVVGTIITFNWGSSKGSRDQTEAMSKKSIIEAETDKKEG